MKTQLLIDRYRLVGIIRQKGLAKTYRAVDERNGEIVAVKMVPTPPGKRDGLPREFSIGSRLSHRNLIRYHDCFQMEDHVGLVTEIVEGEPFLAALSRPEAIALGAAAVIAFRQLCETIEYLHSQGLVHANLTPRVILQTPVGTLKFIDLAHCEEVSSGCDFWGGVFHGTPLYSSPEHLKGPCVYESDYFVVGVLLLEHLIGENPLDGDGPEEVFRTILKIDGLPPSVGLSLLPEDFRGMVGSLLSAVPVRRRSGWRDLLTLLGVSDRDCV